MLEQLDRHVNSSILYEELNINSKLIFNNKAAGKIVFYDELSYLKCIDNSLIPHILNRIDFLMREDIKHYAYQLSIKKSKSSDFKIRHLELLIDNLENQDYIYNSVMKRESTITEAYRIAFKLAFKKRQNRYFNIYGRVFVTEMFEYVEKMIQRMKSNTQRILLGRFQASLKEDFILVLNEHLPEVYFEKSKYLKGIIYRSKTKLVDISRLAIYFQTPIAVSSRKFDEGDLVLIDMENDYLKKCNDAKELLEFKLKTNSIPYSDHAVKLIQESNFKLIGMISNYLDVDVVANNPYMQYGLMYDTSHVVIAKGTNLSFEEWYKRLYYIFSIYQGDEIFVRIPLFDTNFKPIDIAVGETTFHSLVNNSDYYETLVSALAHVHHKYSDKIVTVIIPRVENKDEFKLWKSQIEGLYKENNRNGSIYISAEFDTEKSMHAQNEFTKISDFIMNVDELSARYVKEFQFSKDHLSREKIYNSYLYADLQYTRVIYKNSKYKPRCILSGFHLQSEGVFSRVIIGGYRNFIIPAHVSEHVIEIIERHIHGRGKFIGVLKKDRERTMFYREFRSKYNLKLSSQKLKKAYKNHLKYLEEEKKKKVDTKEEKKEENSDKKNNKNNKD